MEKGHNLKEKSRLDRLNKIGLKFNRLKIISEGEIKQRMYTYNCLCDCGSFLKNASFHCLKIGYTKSCGCHRKEKWQLFNSEINLPKRLKENVVINNKGCWEWQKGLDVCGYGVIKINKKSFPTHRKSYETFVGEIPKGLWVLHKCDNPKCINPDHLFLGNQAENSKDMWNKGRGKGVGWKNILTKEQVLEIRNLYPKFSILKLGKMYNKHHATIWMIVNRKSWKNI